MAAREPHFVMLRRRVSLVPFVLATLTAIHALPVESSEPVSPGASATEAWAARYDGGGNDETTALSVDSTGAAYVTGLSAGPNQYDVVTIKYAPSGQELWRARFDGAASAMDEGLALTHSPAGYVYVATRTETRPGDLDFGILQYDAATGELRWARQIDGYQQTPEDCASAACGPTPGKKVAHDRANAVVALPDGGVAAAGTVNGEDGYDYLVARYSADGDLLWTHRYDGPDHSADHATALTVDKAGNLFVTGRSRGTRHFDIATLKLRPDGQRAWVRRYDGPPGWFDGAGSIAVGPSGNVAVAGTSFGRYRATAAVVLAYSNQGQPLWTARPLDDRDSSRLASVAFTDAGEVVAAGDISLGGNWNFLTFKLNADGEPVWLAEYDGAGAITDRSLALGLDAKGNAFVSGVTNMTNDSQCDACPMVTTLKYSTAEGRLLWEATYQGPQTGANRAAAVSVQGSDVWVTGMSVGADSARGTIGDSPRDYVLLRYRGVAD